MFVYFGKVSWFERKKKSFEIANKNINLNKFFFFFFFYVFIFSINRSIYILQKKNPKWDQDISFSSIYFISYSRSYYIYLYVYFFLRTFRLEEEKKTWTIAFEFLLRFSVFFFDGNPKKCSFFFVLHMYDCFFYFR